VGGDNGDGLKPDPGQPRDPVYPGSGAARDRVPQHSQRQHRNLWCSSRRGIVCLDRKSLLGLEAGARGGVSWISYGVDDG